MKQVMRTNGSSSAAAAARNPLSRPGSRSLDHWPSEFTRSEGAWAGRPGCPLLPRMVASHGFLRDRLHVLTGAVPLAEVMSDEAIDATLTLMLRRGRY
jgi:hypothetical protein